MRRRAEKPGVVMEGSSHSCRKLPVRSKGGCKTKPNVTPFGNARKAEVWEERMLCSLG